MKVRWMNVYQNRRDGEIVYGSKFSQRRSCPTGNVNWKVLYRVKITYK